MHVNLRCRKALKGSVCNYLLAKAFGETGSAPRATAQVGSLEYLLSFFSTSRLSNLPIVNSFSPQSEGGPFRARSFEVLKSSFSHQSSAHQWGDVLLPAVGGHGVPEGLIPALPAVPLLLVVLPEAEEPGVLADELVDPFAEPGKVPQLLGVVEDVPPGFAVELPGAPGVTVFGVVEFGVLVVGVVVFGVVVLGLAVLGVVVLGVVVPGVVCVVPGVDGVVLCGVVVPGVVPDCGVVVPVGDVGVPVGGVVAPGVELCPAGPVPPAGAVPPAGELCATTQVPQHKIADSKVSLVIDIS